MKRKPGPVASPDASTGRLLAALAECTAPALSRELAEMAGVPSKQVSRYLGPLVKAGKVKAFTFKRPFRYSEVRP